MKTCRYCRNQWPATRERCQSCGACLPCQDVPAIFIDASVIDYERWGSGRVFPGSVIPVKRKHGLENCLFQTITPLLEQDPSMRYGAV